MARAIETDPYHNFRFQLVDPNGGNLDPVAGFTMVSMPDHTQTIAEYREGTDKYTKKFPGVNSVSDITFEKGIFRRDSDLYDWFLKTVNGGEEYRTDLILNEFHIADEFGINGSPSRVTRLEEVLPSSVKPTADKDATSSEVAIASMTCAVERFFPVLLPNA